MEITVRNTMGIDNGSHSKPYYGSGEASHRMIESAQAIQPDEQTQSHNLGEPEQAGPAWQRIQKLLGVPGVGRMSGVAAGVLLSGGVWLALPETDLGGDDCNNAGHETAQIGFSNNLKDKIRNPFPGDNLHSWSDVAAQLSTDHGYDISPARLILSNESLLSKKTAMNQDNLALRGSICFTVPGPIAAGLVETSGTQTGAEIAQDNDMPLSQLQILNPGINLTGSSVELPGKVLKVQVATDSGYVLRSAAGRSINQIAQSNPKLRDKLVDVNGTIFSAMVLDGSTLTTPTSIYLPPFRTKWMQAHKVTIDDVTAEYANSTAQVGVKQIVQPQLQASR